MKGRIPVLDAILWRVMSRDMPRMSEADWSRLTATARILARDEQGDTTLLCGDSVVAKTFSLKRRLSSAVLRPYARRFADNARMLATCAILAPRVDGLFARDAARRHVVTYPWMDGVDLRTAVPRGNAPSLVHRLGRLCGELHQNGVLFRSLHFGNVLVLAGGALALLDVVDCRFLPMGEPPAGADRAANLRQLLRYPEDEAVLRQHAAAFMTGYLEEMFQSGSDAEEFQRAAPDGLLHA